MLCFSVNQKENEYTVEEQWKNIVFLFRGLKLWLKKFTFFFFFVLFWKKK